MVLMKGQFSVQEKRIIEEVSEDKLMSHVHEISKYVRMSGSEDEAKSLEYVKKTLASYGFKVREYRFDAYIGEPKHTELVVLSPEAKTINGVTAALAPSTPADGVEAEIVYVGAGTESEIGRQDVRGKLVLVKELAEPEIAKRADKAGAVGEIFINDYYAHEGIVSVVWGTPRLETTSLLPSTPCISITEKDGDYLLQLLGKGRVTAKLKAESWRGWKKIPVVTADLPGTIERDRFALFAGHIDSWHYGAMDNGSANAVMLEVARIISKHRKEIRRGLRVAFWSGHSHGRYAGSTWYADNFWLDLEKNCVAHVYTDSAGAKGATILTETDVMPETMDLASSAVTRVTGQKVSGRGFSRAGDQSFWGIGIPSLFMLLSQIPVEAGRKNPDLRTVALFGPSPTGLGWWWHTPEDTEDKIDPHNLKRDATVYALTTFALCFNPIIPLNYERAADQLKQHLTELQQASKETFDLKPLIAQATKLSILMRKFKARARRVKPNEKAKIAVYNETLMRLSRTLVPITQTRAGRYDHDPAVPVPTLPILDAIPRLVKLDRASDEFKFLRNGLRRDANQVADALDKAIETVDCAMRRTGKQ
ncbi:MAG: M28 family peptidase [Candidatus Bathyarchaeia archaeon]